MSHEDQVKCMVKFSIFMSSSPTKEIMPLWQMLLIRFEAGLPNSKPLTPARPSLRKRNPGNGCKVQVSLKRGALCRCLQEGCIARKSRRVVDRDILNLGFDEFIQLRSAIQPHLSSSSTISPKTSFLPPVHILPSSPSTSLTRS